MVSLCLASLHLLLCPALLVYFAHLAWLMAGIICFSCRNWCKIVIEANLKTSRNAHITSGRPVSPADSKSSSKLQHLRILIRIAAPPIQRK
jgi:hypothetical protein